MNIHTSKINISIPEQFLKAVDKAARDCLMPRSSFIRLALMEKMGWKNLMHDPDEGQENDSKPEKVSNSTKNEGKTTIGSAKLTDGERIAMFEKLYRDG